MKTALQEEDEPEASEPGGQKKILSPEEKTKKLQKEQAMLAQVECPLMDDHMVLILLATESKGTRRESSGVGQESGAQTQYLL